jgi:hypothetical protein
MTGRHGWCEDSIYFDHLGECRDPETHRHCPGGWRGVVSLKPGPDGQRRRKSDTGMAIEEIIRLVGHSSSNVTETVYRHQIRPVITVGAEAMDKIFASEH